MSCYTTHQFSFGQLFIFMLLRFTFFYPIIIGNSNGVLKQQTQLYRWLELMKEPQMVGEYNL